MPEEVPAAIYDFLIGGSPPVRDPLPARVSVLLGAPGQARLDYLDEFGSRFALP